MNNLTLPLIVDVLRDLRINFPGKRDGQDIQRQAEIYREGLTGISADGLRHASRRAIQEDAFFPKVARLRELAASYDAYQRNSQPATAADEARCRNCGEDFRLIRKHRPFFGKLANGDPDHRRGWLTSADGEWLLLQPYDRLGCRCTARDEHMPHPDLDPLAERIIPGVHLAVPTTRSSLQPR